MSMLRHYSYIFASMFILMGCSPPMPSPENKKQQTTAELEFQPPMGPWGLPYRVGNLGGKPVNLGEGVEYLEYDDMRFFSKEKNRNHNYTSKVVSFGFSFRYPNELFLIKYYKAPREAYNAFKTEQFLPDNQWVRVSVDGENPDSNHPERIFKYLTELANYSEEYEYFREYIATNEIEYGLEKYIPHPSWVERNNQLRKKMGIRVSII